MLARDYIKYKAPLLFDGAMGTLYASLPGCEAKRVEAANIDEPEKISAIHRAYLEAGSRAIKTNTFSLSSDLAQRAEEYAFSLIDAACVLACEAAEDYGAYVFADIGPAPLGARLSPGENYISQAERFIKNGVDCFLLETLSSDVGIAEFGNWLKDLLPESCLIVSYAVGPDGYTHDGHTGRELLERSCALGCIDAVGINCFMGPYHMLQYVSTLPKLKLPLAVMPNSGYPTVRGKHAVYGGSPPYFADNAKRIIDSGAAVIGGCCGTKPEHIRYLNSLLAKSDNSRTTAGTAKAVSDIPMKAKNALREKLESGQRILAVEYDPPSNDNVAAFLEGVQALSAAGADAVTIADCPVGVPRVDSSLMACRVKRELGVEVIPHMACRDRNLNAAKALLLGLSSQDVHNVLLVTGDPMPSATRDEVKSVFNCNSRKLAKYVQSLYPQSLGEAFQIFGALNVNVRNFDIQLSMALEKEANGVTCFMTQPILSQEALENLKKARKLLKSKILGGIYPVVSYRNAVFMNNEIAGIKVSDEICEMYKGLEREEAEELAYSLSMQIAREIEPYTDGLYIMVPYNRTALVSSNIKGIKDN